MASEKPIRVAIICVWLELPGRLIERLVVPGVSFFCGLPLVRGVFGKRWERLKSRWFAVIWYRRFAEKLCEAYRRAGVEARVHYHLWPRIMPRLVQRYDADLVLLPHKQHWEFPECRTPLLFYNQAIFRWLFTVDAKGWAAGSSRYPCDYSKGKAESRTYEQYRRYLQENSSKYTQPERVDKTELAERQIIPEAPYLFFPCQIPDDKNIDYFSPLPHDQIVAKLVEWANSRKRHIIFKQHPQNPHHKALKGIVRGEYVRLLDADCDASVHDMIQYAEGIYTINSGVGLEAIIAGKPVVTLGKCEYDCVTIRGNIDHLEGLDATFEQVQALDREALEQRYRQFIDWFCRHYAIDMQDEERLEARLAGVVRQSEALVADRV